MSYSCIFAVAASVTLNAAHPCAGSLICHGLAAAPIGGPGVPSIRLTTPACGACTPVPFKSTPIVAAFAPKLSTITTPTLLPPPPMLLLRGGCRSGWSAERSAAYVPVPPYAKARRWRGVPGRRAALPCTARSVDATPSAPAHLPKQPPGHSSPVPGLFKRNGNEACVSATGPGQHGLTNRHSYTMMT